jgi:hypothetical protein
LTFWPITLAIGIYSCVNPAVWIIGRDYHLPSDKMRDADRVHRSRALRRLGDSGGASGMCARS